MQYCIPALYQANLIPTQRLKHVLVDCAHIITSFHSLIFP